MPQSTATPRRASPAPSDPGKPHTPQKGPISGQFRPKLDPKQPAPKQSSKHSGHGAATPTPTPSPVHAATAAHRPNAYPQPSATPDQKLRVMRAGSKIISAVRRPAGAGGGGAPGGGAGGWG